MDDLLHGAKHTPYMTTIDLPTVGLPPDECLGVCERLLLFKLHANRNKCNFVCGRLKYLGHYITSSLVEVDPGKASAIREMLPPKNVKQVLPFMQTCSCSARQRTSKFMPRRDGPCVILGQLSPTVFEMANLDVPIGVYRTSALRPHQDSSSKHVTSLCKRGRPRKTLPPLAAPWRGGG
ncbi:hypothetical protein HNY73_006212 [Argiope bruennichi]|uniref:Uncharacterized protein n=1 Tax=Argiope bruennichi TaxID=94029 RepID=A0A8T0FLR3_ARGBR|nr:hypothetical protein HNY73_006212 [Argiope bruennichi]